MALSERLGQPSVMARPEVPVKSPRRREVPDVDDPMSPPTPASPTVIPEKEPVPVRVLPRR